LRGAAVSVRRVIAAVRRSGVAREDIRTDVVRLERVRVRRSQRRVFVARNAIVVVVRRLDAAGSVVDRAVRAGATDVDGPQFGVSDAAEVYRRTLAAAYADARRKAERLAAEAGVRSARRCGSARAGSRRRARASSRQWWRRGRTGRVDACRAGPQPHHRLGFGDVRHPVRKLGSMVRKEVITSGDGPR
jgi:uncharacterized protein YggE